MEAIQAATIVPARAMGLDKESGNGGERKARRPDSDQRQSARGHPQHPQRRVRDHQRRRCITRQNSGRAWDSSREAVCGTSALRVTAAVDRYASLRYGQTHLLSQDCQQRRSQALRETLRNPHRLETAAAMQSARPSYAPPSRTRQTFPQRQGWALHRVRHSRDDAAGDAATARSIWRRDFPTSPLPPRSNRPPSRPLRPT